MTSWDSFTGTTSTPADHLADYLLTKLGRLETLKLQKLLYYCNGWSLGLTGKPIFTDAIEAWKHGPVIPHIYRQHSREASVGSWPNGNHTSLSPVDRAVADAVIKSYGALSGWALREMTHRESPWLEAWEESEYGKIRNVKITPEAMDEYFTAEARNGRAQQRAKAHL